MTMPPAEVNGSPVALRVSDVSKAYGSTQALDDASFEVRRGRIHALLGGNGSGKSTLIKILAGVVPADRGSVEVAGVEYDARGLTPARAREMGLHVVHQQSSTFPDLTIAENLALGRGFEIGMGGRVRWSALRRRTAGVLQRFNIDADPDTQVGTLGPAAQTMIAIARALQDQEGEHDGVLLLDEATASLPRSEVDLLLAAVRRYAEAGQTIVFVTHRLDEVTQIADHATILRDGRVVATVDRGEFDHDSLVTLIMGQPVERLASRPVGSSAGEPVLELRSTNGDGADLTVRAGEIVGVAGLLGSGRSSLLRGLFGLAPMPGRTVELDGRGVDVQGPRQAIAAGIAYVPEDRAAEGVFADLSVKENLSVTVLGRYWRGGWFSRRSEQRGARAVMDAFLVRAASADAPVSSLSGGNQQKIVLGRWLQRHPRLLLLDEPTQGVDVGARADIHRVIRNLVSDGAGALMVSSDFDELAAVCDRAIVVRAGHIVGEIAGADLREETLNVAIHAQENRV